MISNGTPPFGGEIPEQKVINRLRGGPHKKTHANNPYSFKIHTQGLTFLETRKGPQT